jgi:hypothetical protein
LSDPEVIAATTGSNKGGVGCRAVVNGDGSPTPRSSGVSVIATALQATRARGGQLVPFSLSEWTRLVLDITGMTKILDIRDPLDSNEQFAVEWTVA